MSKLSIDEINQMLSDCRTTKSKHLREVDNLDTKIIGLKIELEKRIESVRRQEQNVRDSEHQIPFDE